MLELIYSKIFLTVVYDVKGKLDTCAETRSLLYVLSSIRNT